MMMEPIPERANAVADHAFATVLPSAHLLGNIRGELSEDRVKRGLRDLKEREFVDVHELGCLLPSTPVVIWTEKGLDHFGANEMKRSWLGPSGLGTLVVYDFAKVEAVNSLAPLYASGGWLLQQIHFFDHQPMFAAAAYHHPDHHAPAYILFCWASVLETQRELFERLGGMEDAIRAQFMDLARTFWPAGIAILAASEWTVARALCLAPAALDGWVHRSNVSAWFYGSGGWRMSDALSALTGEPPLRIPPLLDPVHELRPSLSTRRLGNRTLRDILDRSLYAGRGRHKLIELLTLVAIYPCGSIAHYQRLVGERGRGNETRRRMKVLQEMGLIEVVTERGRARQRKGWPDGIPLTLSDRGQGEPRYAATLAGRVQFCYVHGGRPEQIFTKTKLGRLKTIVRSKVLMLLSVLSWMVNLSCAPGLRPVDRSRLAEIAHNWKNFRQKVLVHLLTLACTLYLNQTPGRSPVDSLTLAAMTRIWTQLTASFIEDRWLYQHEDIVYETLGQVREAGCSFAPGWQASTTLADGWLRIDPDAVVRVETPWGRTWCYLEVELSDTRFEDIEPRCLKYGSTDRRDNLPVLIVCRDDQAEENFHLAAAHSDLPPRMLTTTLTRLRNGEMFGPGVWSLNGERVILAP